MDFVQHSDAAVDLKLRSCPEVPENGAHEGHAQGADEPPQTPVGRAHTKPSAKELRVRVPAFFVLHNAHRAGRLH